MLAIFHDTRARAIAAQVILVAAVVVTVWWLASNTAANLAARGIAVGFGYIASAARFPISETLIAYEPTDSFGQAYLVGLLNTLFVSTIVVMGATVLGFAVALGRRSRHPLTNSIASVFVEFMRNTPLVVQLLFWYALLTSSLPSARQALNPLPGIFLSVRGLFFPSLHPEGNWTIATIVIAGAILTMLALLILARRRRLRLGQSQRWLWPALATVLTVASIAILSSGAMLRLDTPELRGFNFVGGTRLTPEFASLIVGLILYSSAFVGEIIRGGIDAVGKGQWEAGRSVGLRDPQILRFIVVPQALRIIIPPMTSQYFNIVKNTTLALVVGYPDISFVVATTINQTGQVIEGIVILISVFLTISMAVSLFMNWYNRRVALVQR
ncbi:MAG: amino acid ABC transporter permease [Beijerinckiaceae bacterium]